MAWQSRRLPAGTWCRWQGRRTPPRMCWWPVSLERSAHEEVHVAVAVRADRVGCPRVRVLLVGAARAPAHAGGPRSATRGARLGARRQIGEVVDGVPGHAT